MSHLSIPRSAEADVVDANFGEALTMSALPRVILSALVLEHDDLVATAVLDDLTGDFGPLEHRHTRADVVTVGAEQHFVELDVTAGVADERRNAICLARLDTILLAAGFYDGVRHGNGKFGRTRKPKPMRG